MCLSFILCCPFTFVVCIRASRYTLVPGTLSLLCSFLILIVVLDGILYTDM